MLHSNVSQQTHFSWLGRVFIESKDLKASNYAMQDCNAYHRENGGTLGMVPLIINPIYTIYSGYLLGIFPFKGLLGGLNR